MALPRNSRPPLLPSPGRTQFSTRTLLVVVAVVGVGFAVAKLISILWTAVLLWLVLLAGLHVFGNYWGTRTRDAASARCAASAEALTTPAAPPPLAPQTPASQLRDPSHLSRITLVAAIVGAVTAGIGGALLLRGMNLKGLDGLGLAIGAVSSAVVGGFLGFLAGSFLDVALRALFEAAYWESPVHLRRPAVLRLAGLLLMIAGVLATVLAINIYAAKINPWDGSAPVRTPFQWFAFGLAIVCGFSGTLGGMLMVVTAQARLARQAPRDP